MSKLRKHLVLPTLALLGAAFVYGCSMQPTAPISSTQTPGVYTDPSFVTVSNPLGFSAGTEVPVPLTVTQTVSGALGGIVTAGRFRVVVPAGAFNDLADITIHVPDQSVLRCFLDITPQSANAFAIPVALEANCFGSSLQSATDAAVVRFEPSMSAWATVPGTSASDTTWTVQARLEHFSEYGVVDTKAGW